MLMWSLTHGFIWAFAALTGCLAIQWQSAEALAVYDFELTPHFLCLLMLCLCVAAHPGLICGESVLPGVDGCVQASEVWLQLS